MLLSKFFDKNQISFLKSVHNINDLPKSKLPEFAFIGRSNVGKSSLINALTGLTKLAKISNVPGKTISLNFYNVANKLYLVDLPGYGFAKLSKTFQNEIGDLLGGYFTTSANLLLTFVLIDSRHEMKQNDLDMITYFADLQKEIFIVLTKCDKRDEKTEYWQKQITELSNVFMNIRGMVFSSSKNKIGMNDLRKIIISTLNV